MNDVAGDGFFCRAPRDLGIEGREPRMVFANLSVQQPLLRPSRRGRIGTDAPATLHDAKQRRRPGCTHLLGIQFILRAGDVRTGDGGIPDRSMDRPHAPAGLP